MKKIRISFADRTRFADSWALQLGRMQMLLENQSLHPAEFCAQMILMVWRDVFGNSFHNGKYPTEVLPFRLRFLSTVVNQGLGRWLAQEIQLELKFHVPDPLEVLRAQAQGKRIVSALITKEEILNFEEHGRDFTSFLIHDLVHAHHFFADEPGEFERQVVFSGWMKEIVENGTWDCLLRLKPEMRTQFEYLISDMNTHTWHLIKTLKSLLDQASLPDLELQFLKVMGSEFQELWSKINSPCESYPLTTEFLRRMLEKAPARSENFAFFPIKSLGTSKTVSVFF